MSDLHIQNIMDEIFDYWFMKKNDFNKWFVKSSETDKYIEQNFSKYINDANNFRLEKLKETPQGCLILIILYDQFPRNIYRNTFRGYAFDGKALKLTHKLIKNNWLSEFTPNMIMFSLMPLMHTESIPDKEYLISLLQKYQLNLKDKDDMTFTSMIDYTRKHLLILKQYGRYPHRNYAFNRISTKEEKIYLEKLESDQF
jgi:uncharacterized protein (DUF924 family)